MTDRDRLITLLQEFTDNNNGGGSNHGRADYLIENGVIVPPCKGGDTVYIIYPDPRYNWGNKELKISELKVYAFHYYDNKVTVEIRGDGKYITWDISCFGVNVFLTREEAEKALKE